MGNFPEIDTSGIPSANPPMLPAVRRDWLVFLLAAGCLILAGVSICLGIAVTRRYTPKVITREVEIVVEKEVPVEVVKEVEKPKIVKVGGTDFGFHSGPLRVSESKLLECFKRLEEYPALTFTKTDAGWSDANAGVMIAFFVVDGELGGLQLTTHIDSIQDAKIAGTRDFKRVIRFATALEQAVEVVNPSAAPIVTQWAVANLLQFNNVAHCDLLGTRVSIKTVVINKVGGMVLMAGIGNDPEGTSGKPR